MQVMSLTSSIYDQFYHLTVKCDLDRQPTNLHFFTKNPNLKKNVCFCFFLFFAGWGVEGRGGGGLGGVGRGEGGGQGSMDGQRNKPKPICPFNFFEVGVITMN